MNQVSFEICRNKSKNWIHSSHTWSNVLSKKEENLLGLWLLLCLGWNWDTAVIWGMTPKSKNN